MSCDLKGRNSDHGTYKIEKRKTHRKCRITKKGKKGRKIRIRKKKHKKIERKKDRETKQKKRYEVIVIRQDITRYEKRKNGSAHHI